LEEFNETTGIMDGELKQNHHSMEITFTAWIVCCPPTIKNIKLEIADQFLGHISRILVGYFKSIGISKIGHY
jgi:hypothetical protein